MKLQAILPIALLALFAGANPALAQGSPSTAQVRAELAAAIRSGNVLAAGEIGLPLNQVHPHRYPAPTQVPGKPRGEVKADLAEALRTGNITFGESSLNRNEAFPNLYPPVPMVAGKSREEAKAELAAALRSGDILTGGEVAVTRRQASPWSYSMEAREQRRPRFEARRGTVSLPF